MKFGAGVILECLFGIIAATTVLTIERCETQVSESTIREYVLRFFKGLIGIPVAMIGSLTIHGLVVIFLIQSVLWVLSIDSTVYIAQLLPVYLSFAFVGLGINLVVAVSWWSEQSEPIVQSDVELEETA